MAKDRFDLEELIMKNWQTRDDLELIAEGVLEDPEMNSDKIANALTGLAELHDLRCKQLWACFEELIASRKLAN